MNERCLCTGPGHCPWHDCVVGPDLWRECKAGKPPQPQGEPCLYLGKQMGNPQDKTYVCNLYEKCTLVPSESDLPNCVDCKDKLRMTDRRWRRKWKDPLLITDRDGKPTHCLRDMLGGRSAFLVCGGPSLNQLPFQRLGERGIFSLGINNVAGYAPVSAFTCSDPPSKFHWGIFCDPKIMKFLPRPKLKRRRGRLRKKLEDGSFEQMKISTCDCPNVWGYDRRVWLSLDKTWFTTPQASWGNLNEGVERCGERKTACTMLLGIRLLQYLGAKRIFLLGVDFNMRSDVGVSDNYAFGEYRLPNAVRSNNSQYENTARWLSGLKPVFDEWNFEIYNCNPYSALRVFEHVPFEQALEDCRGEVPSTKFDLENWYKHTGKKEESP